MHRLPGKFVWYEHVSNAVDAARAFYRDLFAWTSDPVPMGDQPYNMIMNGADAVGGFRAAMAGMPNHWMAYVSVESVDDAVRKAQAAGGQVLMQATDFGSVGRGATLADPTGAIFSLWTGNGDDRADVERVPAGDWYWTECMTPDAAKALAFYERVLGYAHEAMDLGAQGTYHVLKANGVPRAGIMQMAGPAGWIPYVSVADCDAAAARAEALGGKTYAGPMTMEGVGRFAVLADPFGAGIGVIKGEQSA